ncbi:peroxiredoxin [Wenxinia marina]|uniref:Glutathione-dependent peroxiredoxin n=1 Tax=Wenxinia marina DSM 24838 TaxID=1123501 RepID=A0A0D0Q8W2_9RHOB|nr:peroxiredoxin [Wenxinia marina]KIQ70849.1 Peroxiredoxin [Wenxinia marina DSM 24838]GGL56821.1 peroxiredoxin [Wenxinia marina]
MTIDVGDRLPEATFLKIGPEGPQQVTLADLIGTGKAVIFGLPGAYTGTCTTAHVPSFIRTMGRFQEKGVDKVICVAVNDPFVMNAWANETGAKAAGIEMAADASGEFTRAIGMDFTAPPAGFYGRSRRYSMYVENRTVRILNAEESPGMCETSAGETLVEQL